MLHVRQIKTLGRRMPGDSAPFLAVAVLAGALWMGGTVPAAAQGTIIIDGNALGRIIAGGIRIEQEEQQRSGTRRSIRSQPKARVKTHSASRDKGSRKPSKVKKTEQARQSTEPDSDASKATGQPAPQDAAQQPAPATATANAVAPEPAPPLVAAPAVILPQPQPAPAAITAQQPTPPAAPPVAPARPVQVAAPVAPPVLAPPVTSAATPPAAAKTISSAAEIASAQEHLKFLGYEIPQTGGEMDLKTKIAIMQFQDSLGATTTGNLTLEQLQTLFQKAAARSQGK